MGGITIDPSDLGIEANTGKSSKKEGGAFTIDPKDLAPAAQTSVPTINLTREQASPSLADSLKRGVGLTVRNYGPYVGASAAGAALGSEFGPPGMVAGAVAGPALLGLTDLAATGYNAVAPMLGAPRMTTGTEAFDALMDRAGVPRAQTGGEKLVQNMTRAAVPTAATAKTMQTLATAPSVMTNGNLGRNLASTLAANPGSQIAASVGGSAVPTIAQEGLDIQNPAALTGLGVVGSIGAGGIASRMGNTRFSPTAGSNYANPETGNLVESARKMGVNLTAPDVAPDSFAARLINTARRYGGNREEINRGTTGQVINAVENAVESNRPAKLAPGESADRMIANDLRTQYSAAKKTASTMYDAVETAIAQNPQSGQMLPSSTQQAAAALKADFPEWATLTNASRSTSSRIDSLLGGIGQNSGPFTGVGGGVKTSSFQEMRTLSKEVGKLVEASRTDPKLADVHGKLKALYGAIQSDFDNWAASTGNKQAADAYTKAQDFFKTNVAPFRDDSTIYRAVSSRTPTGDFDKQAQKIGERILGSGNETTNLAVTLMSPEGRQALAFKVMEGARARGINEDAGQLFSAPGFLRGVNLGRGDTPTAQSIALQGSPQAMQTMDELRPVINSTRNYNVPKATPVNGSMLMPMAATGVEASSGAALASYLGLSPELGALAGVAASPVAARGINGLLSGPEMTRYLLGQKYKAGSGLLQVPIDASRGEQ